MDAGQYLSMPRWKLLQGRARIDGRRLHRGTKRSRPSGLRPQILRLEALTCEGLVLSDPPPEGSITLDGALRLETPSSAPPQGGFILHLGCDDESEYVSLHIPIEKDVFEIWKLVPGGFQCELRRSCPRPAIGEIQRFELQRHGGCWSFALRGEKLVSELRIPRWDGALGLAAKFCKVTLWLEGFSDR